MHASCHPAGHALIYRKIDRHDKKIKGRSTCQRKNSPRSCLKKCHRRKGSHNRFHPIARYVSDMCKTLHTWKAQTGTRSPIRTHLCARSRKELQRTADSQTEFSIAVLWQLKCITFSEVIHVRSCWEMLLLWSRLVLPRKNPATCTR